jgi:outer membrane protein OmpA-like peptidoglycan-associated protein
MRISSAVIAAGLLAGLCTAASAQTDGLYVGAEAGVNFVPKLKFDAYSANSWAQKQDPGYAIAGQVGYGFGNIRLEGEFGWRQNDLSKFTNALGEQSTDGNISGLSVMGNVYYDFVNSSKFTPYIGAGFGGINVATNNIKAGGVQVSDDSNFVPAYQGIAGVAYSVNDQLSIKADYHYLRTLNDANLGVSDSYGGGYAQGPYQSHSVMVGFTWKFGSAPVQQVAQAVAAPTPPPPAPAPAPAPAPKPVQAAPIPKNFMIFFDFDKSELTPEAKSILTQAADAAKKQNSSGIDLTGYTDTVGSAPYNQKLSERRAEAAKKFLVSIGVPANQIQTAGKGKTDLLVPTKDGVREAQNRRVQIVLQ